MHTTQRHYSKAIVLFSSGTGNSFKASLWMMEEAEKRSITVEHNSIEKFDKKNLITSERLLLALYFPTHGFTAPWHIIKFAMKLPRAQGASAIVIPSRAGVKFGKFFPPGLSGSAAFVLSIILFLKGFAVKGFTALDMPSNWFSLHPIQSKTSHIEIIDRARKKHQKFSDIILNGSYKWLCIDFFYEIIFGTALLPISILYLLIGKIFLAKLFFANNNCNACGLCSEKCPIGAIKMFGKKNPRPYWKYNCESCMRCAGFCPNKAIEAGHSWAAMLIQITSIPVAWLFFSLTGGNILLFDFRDSLLGTIINTLYVYPSIIVSYFFFHLVIRFPFFNKLFSLTTFTHYWGRYKAPGIKIKDFS